MMIIFLTLLTDLSGADKSRTMIILDASGSMWGRMAGKVKIKTVKKILSKSIEASDPKAELGLMVYGHRAKKDCNDIETIIPVGPVDKKKMISALVSIEARGKAPISQALRKASQELNNSKGITKIVLMADGTESCKKNPCTTVKALKKEKPDFVADVIAINVNKKAQKQLSCIASATGGTYFPVKNSTDLEKLIRSRVIIPVAADAGTEVNTTIQKMIETNTTERATPKTVMAPSPDAASKPGVTTASNSVPEPDAAPKSTIVSKPNAASKAKQVPKSSPASKPNSAPKPDHMSKPDITAGERVSSKSKKSREKPANTERATVEADASLTAKGEQIDALYDIYPLGDGMISRSKPISCTHKQKAPCRKKLAAGRYLIKASYKEKRQKREFRLKPGETKKIHFIFPLREKVEISASAKESGKTIKAYHRIYRMISDDSRSAIVTSCNSYNKKACAIELRTGKYLLLSKSGKSSKETKFDVAAGKVSKINIVMEENLSPKDLTAPKINQPKQIRKATKEQNTSRVKVVPHIPKIKIPVKKPVLLTPENNITGSRIVAAKTQTSPKEAKQTGEAEISASEGEGGAWVKAYHRIYKVVNGKVDSSTQGSCNSYKKEACLEQLPVGNYLVKTAYNGVEKETAFEIKKNKRTKVHVTISQIGKAEISASETEKGSKVEAYHRIFRMVNDKAGSAILISCNSHKNEACIEKLPAGRYLLKSSYNGINKEMPFEIKAGETSKIKMVVGRTGNVEISASETEGGAKIKAYHRIYRALNGEANGASLMSCNSYEKEPCRGKLPAGNYLVKSVYSETKREKHFKVKAGKTTKVHIQMGQAGKVEIMASKKRDGKKIEAFHRIYRIKNGTPNSAMLLSCNSHKKEACVEKLPAGSYLLKSSSDDAKKETHFKVISGQTSAVNVNFAPFHLSVKGINPCTAISYEVLSATGKTITERKSLASRGVDFNLPDGNYTIISTIGDLSRKTKVILGGEHSSKDVLVDFGGSGEKNKIEGIWNTTRGKATIQVYGKKIKGEYSSNHGELIGEMTYPQRMEGYWIEDHSNEKCTEAKNGRYFWGKVIWEFDQDFCSFKGKRNYCDKKPSKSWSGTYRQALPIELTRKALIQSNKKTLNKIEENQSAESTAGKSPEPQKAAPPKSMQQQKLSKITRELKRLCKTISEDDSEDLKQQCRMLEMFSDVMREAKPNAHQKDTKKQQKENEKADQEFERMSKELKLFID